MEQANVVLTNGARSGLKVCTFGGNGCVWKTYRMFEVVEPKRLIELQEQFSYFISPVEFFLVKGKTKW